MMAFLLIFFFIFFLAGAVYVINSIALAKMFKKAGVEGWKAWIPICNQVFLCQIVGVSPWWILITYIIGTILYVIPYAGILSTAATIYFNVLLSISTARSYGKQDSFGILLFFFTPICYLILAFDGSQYVGKRPMKDEILSIFSNNKNEGYNNNSNNFQNGTSGVVDPSVEVLNQSVVNPKFCAYCGSKLEVSSNFCPYCGARL